MSPSCPLRESSSPSVEASLSGRRCFQHSAPSSWRDRPWALSLGRAQWRGREALDEKGRFKMRPIITNETVLWESKLNHTNQRQLSTEPASLCAEHGVPRRRGSSRLHDIAASTAPSQKPAGRLLASFSGEQWPPVGEHGGRFHH